MALLWCVELTYVAFTAGVGAGVGGFVAIVVGCYSCWLLQLLVVGYLLLLLLLFVVPHKSVSHVV